MKFECSIPFRPFVSISSVKKLSLDLLRARQSIQHSVIVESRYPLTRVRVLFSIRSFFFFFFLRYDYSETNLMIIQWSSFAKNKKKRKTPRSNEILHFFFQRRKWNRVERLISFCITPLWKTFNRLKSLDLYLLVNWRNIFKKKLFFTYIHIYSFNLNLNLEKESITRRRTSF